MLATCLHAPAAIIFMLPHEVQWDYHARWSVKTPKTQINVHVM